MCLRLIEITQKLLEKQQKTLLEEPTPIQIESAELIGFEREKDEFWEYIEPTLALEPTLVPKVEQETTKIWDKVVPDTK